VVLVLLAALFVRNYMQTRNKLQDDPAQLSATIGKFLELPQGEIPTVASVKDAGKLKGQPFFDHAQNDDKVLIYTKSGKAVLYRPSTKRVVEFSRVNLGNATP